MAASDVAVPVQLRELLTVAKRGGEDFDTAWELALDVIDWPASRREETALRDALTDTREAWRAAYECWPQERPELAMAQLALAGEALAA